MLYSLHITSFIKSSQLNKIDSQTLQMATDIAQFLEHCKEQEVV